MRNVAVFVDVQNVYYTTRQVYKSNFDYNAFWAQIGADKNGTETNIAHAFAYAVDRDDDKQRQFQNILRAIGFNVRLKPFIQRKDGTAKGDWDVGITIDVLEYAPKVDVVVLASGDGDFGVLVDTIIEKYGVEVEVYGVRELTAASLMSKATRFKAIEGKLLLKSNSGARS